MRVGLSTATIQPGRRRDGIGVYTAGVAHALPSAGVQVQGFALGQRSPADGLSTATRPGYIGHLFRDIVGLSHPLDLDVDVVHFTDHFVVPCRRPSVATLHDAVPLKYPQWVSPRLRGLKNYAMVRMARHADHVIAISQFAVDELVTYFGIAADRIHVVPNGIDAWWLQPPAGQDAPAPHGPVSAGDRVRIDAAALPVKDYFLFVGTLQPRKNLDRILDAYEALPAGVRQAHPLVVVGRAGWRCDATVNRLKALAGQGASVHWLDRVDSRDQLRGIYLGALALVFTSLHEGFGLPVLEAFACGVPVLTSTESSMPEVAGDGALLVDPHDVEAIREGLRKLAGDASLRRQLVERGRVRVARFTWAHTARQLAAVYTAIA